MIDENEWKKVYPNTSFPTRPVSENKGEGEHQMTYDRSLHKPVDTSASNEAGALFFRSRHADNTPSLGGRESGMIYDKTPPPVDDGERMAEGEIKPLEPIYENSPQFYEEVGGLTPIIIPRFGSETGDADKLYLRDAATFAIGKIQESFDNGTELEILDHWLKVCEESPFVDEVLMPKIRKLAEMGKAVTSPQEFEIFINALKDFRSQMRIKRKGG